MPQIGTTKEIIEYEKEKEKKLSILSQFNRKLTTQHK